MDVKKLLEIRSTKKASKPRFIRQKAGHKVEVGTKYRKPRGYHSKMRLKHKGKGLMPSAGYRAPKLIRGTNESGLNEVLIYSVSDLSKVTKTDVVVVASSVGRRNKIAILEKAVELKLNVNVDASATIKDLKAEFEESKKSRSLKKSARVKVDTKVEKAKSSKKSNKSEKLDTKEEIKEDPKTMKKKQEKILIDKDKAM